MSFAKIYSVSDCQRGKESRTKGMMDEISARSTDTANAAEMCFEITFLCDFFYMLAGMNPNRKLIRLCLRNSRESIEEVDLQEMLSDKMGMSIAKENQMGKGILREARKWNGLACGYVLDAARGGIYQQIKAHYAVINKDDR